MNKLLSIIIPVYNVEQYLDKCLQSIVVGNVNMLGITEIIVVDDGSPDRSGEIADEFAKQYPCIQVIHQKNAGVAAARNTGITTAHGEWLYFVDSDDWLEAGALANICSIARQHPTADILFLDAWKNAGDTQREWEHFEQPAVWTKQEEIRRLQCGMLYFPFIDKKMRTPLAAPWDKVYRRAFVCDNKLCFQEKLRVLDDMVFNVEAFGIAKEVVYNKTKIYHYRYVSDSITNSYKPDRIEQDKAVWAYLEKYIQKRKSAVAWTESDSDEFNRALYCRLIKSFSICCRLCFFHDKNKKTIRQKIAYVKDVLASEPYQTAFQSVRMSDLEWRMKIMAIAGKCRCGWGVYLLYRGQELLQK